MSTLSIKLRYRPLRLGWCVATDDMAALRKAAKYSFTMWGGRYNPIIPLADPKFADALIRLFRVDALVPVSEGTEVKKFVDQYKHLPWPLFQESLFVDSISGNKQAVIRRSLPPDFENLRGST